MRTVNFEDKTRRINELRIECGNKTFSREELIERLKEKGVASSRPNLDPLLKLFPSEVIGHFKIYEMPKTPIHISLVKSVWRKRSKKKETPQISIVSDNNEEDSALKFLQSKGYQIRRVIGFDVERFQRENPDLYKKYLKYEIL